MTRTTTKPRWKDWEVQSITLAFKKKIQHKVIAAALKKSVTAINKKIKKLGLRDPRSQSGRIKGESNFLKMSDKLVQDVSEMISILKSVVTETDKDQPLMAAKVFEKKRKPKIMKIKKKNAEYTLQTPYHYILTRPDKPHQTRIERIVDYPFYVPYEHVERWAISEGYAPVQPCLKKAGLSFWKEGRYFTRAQVLMHINSMRREKKLKPLFYEEDDEESLICAQTQPSPRLRNRPCIVIYHTE